MRLWLVVNKNKEWHKIYANLYNWVSKTIHKLKLKTMVQVPFLAFYLDGHSASMGHWLILEQLFH